MVFSSSMLTKALQRRPSQQALTRPQPLPPSRQEMQQMVPMQQLPGQYGSAPQGMNDLMLRIPQGEMPTGMQGFGQAIAGLQRQPGQMPQPMPRPIPGMGQGTGQMQPTPQFDMTQAAQQAAQQMAAQGLGGSGGGLQRLSPGVYRSPTGELVDSRGQPLPGRMR